MTSRPRYMVLIPSDLQRTAALFRAMALAKRSDAELLLDLFEFDQGLEKAKSRGFDLNAYVLGRGRKLEEFAAHLRREGFAVKTLYHWGQPVTSQILGQVLAAKPDLVIKDVQAEATLRRIIFTTRDLELLRLCPVPLMLVRPGNGTLPKELIAAVDPLDDNGRPHELNEDILHVAQKYGMLCDASVDVVHAFQFIPMIVDSQAVNGWVPDVTLQEELHQVHEKALLDLGNEFGVEERHLHILDGNPAEVIAEFAQTYRAGLAVMGTVYRGGMERLVVGSVAEQLFDRLDCDILALKPHGFAEELSKHLAPDVRKVA